MLSEAYAHQLQYCRLKTCCCQSNRSVYRDQISVWIAEIAWRVELVRLCQRGVWLGHAKSVTTDPWVNSFQGWVVGWGEARCSTELMLRRIVECPMLSRAFGSCPIAGSWKDDPNGHAQTSGCTISLTVVLNFYSHAFALGARWSSEHSQSKDLVIIGPMLWLVETAAWHAFACPFNFGQRRPLPFSGPMEKNVLTGEQENRQLAGASELPLGSCRRI